MAAEFDQCKPSTQDDKQKQELNAIERQILLVGLHRAEHCHGLKTLKYTKGSETKHHEVRGHGLRRNKELPSNKGCVQHGNSCEQRGDVLEVLELTFSLPRFLLVIVYGYAGLLIACKVRNKDLG